MGVNIEGDWVDKIKQVEDNLLDVMQEEFAFHIASNVKEETEREINTGQFDTVGEATAVGLKHTGKYANSFKVANGVRSNNTYIQEIGSTDPKGPKLEYGTEPEENKSLRDGTMIKWAKDKGIDEPVKVGIATAKLIRKNGTVPKPAFRRGQQNTKYNQGRLKRKSIRNIKRRMRQLYP